MLICSSFVVNGKLFWGVDNMHLMEKELGNVEAALLRLVRPPTSPHSATLTIYHDLASPWSFIGSTQVCMEYGSTTLWCYERRWRLLAKTFSKQNFLNY